MESVGLWYLAVAFALGAASGAAAVALLHRPAPEKTAAMPAKLPDSAPADDESSFIDPTTGLANRRYIEMFLRREINRSERLGKPVSIAVFDLDGFRALVDSIGQDAIDSALALMGMALKNGLREYDVVGRYSPGRLIVALPESSADQAFEAVERLHASLASLRLANEPISVSVAVAGCPGDATTPDDLINAAHRALNRGRLHGPNGVFRHEELENIS